MSAFATVDMNAMPVATATPALAKAAPAGPVVAAAAAPAVAAPVTGAPVATAALSPPPAAAPAATVAVAAPAVAVAAPAVAVAAPAVAAPAIAAPVAAVAGPARGAGLSPLGELFRRYDTLGAEAQSLAGAVAAIPGQQAQVGQTTGRLQAQQRAVAAANHDISETHKSIKRNAEPTFFRKLWRGKATREAKVALQQGRLPGLEEKLRGCEAAAAEVSAVLQGEQEQLHKLQNCQARTNAITAEQRGLFRRAVDGAAPTPDMLQLNQAKLDLQGRRIAAEGVRQQAAACLQAFEAAAQGYQNAHQRLMAAAQLNQNAATLNVVGGGSDGAEYMETQQQQARNNAIKQAVGDAEVAQRQLAHAYSTIPQAARERYPHLMGTLATTALPMLQLETMSTAGTFGMKMLLGDLGDAINDSQAAGTIQRNLQQVDMAAQVARQQVGAAANLTNGIAGEIGAIDGQVATTDQQMAAAEQRLFESLRATA